MTEKQKHESRSATPNNNTVDPSVNKPATRPTAPKQLCLDVGIRVEKSIDGIEMGVLENGLSYLTQRGLARFTGSVHSTIYDLTKEWEEKFSDPVIGKSRNDFLKTYLFKRVYKEPTLYLPITQDGSIHHAYPEIVCMAVLEYFAFEAQRPSQIAIANYRSLARYGLQKFIYDALQYEPVDKWRYFQDRVSMLRDSAPTGYFTVFRETAGLVVDLIAADLTVNDKTVPDISVGQAWGIHWNAINLEAKFGPRTKYEHNYPRYYPQASSNPQEPWAYPDAAVPEFRRWFRAEYLVTKFPKYILSKAQMLPGGRQEAQQIAESFEQKALNE